MKIEDQNHQLFRGLLQSEDGRITKIVDSDRRRIVFETEFLLSGLLVERLKSQPEHIVFSERSRIARLGVQIECQRPSVDGLEGSILRMKLTATAMISGYPGLDELRPFFTTGFPVGRLVFCDPDALLTSDQVLEALESAQLKLPASTTISSDGSIVLAPHKVVCRLKEKLDNKTLGQILYAEGGRELLNRWQTRREVSAVIIPPEDGVITTCSMYLHDHYVLLQSRSELGKHLPATILDPIKTRGIRTYLEIVNRSRHPIVNPLILAKIYRTSLVAPSRPKGAVSKSGPSLSYQDLRLLEKTFNQLPGSTCHYLDRPAALIEEGKNISQASIFMNGPEKNCTATLSECFLDRTDYSLKSTCPHVYATSRIKAALPGKKPATLALKYFPNLTEHNDIINLCHQDLIDGFYFFEPSFEHGQFLSERDHLHLQEYEAFGLKVIWVSDLNKGPMVHTLRDGKGYFVAPDRLAAFHKSMLFAFYGSNLPLSDQGLVRLGRLLDALIEFWGRNIGIVTGGGSGIMKSVNDLARAKGMLSGANYLDITDQPMTTGLDFCQVFQSTCRHSRQKWFEVASFPIFNIGGIGSLEEFGITLCNMKLAVMEPVPIILFDTEGDGGYWRHLTGQIERMVQDERAPQWAVANLVITNQPDRVVEAYRTHLQLF